MTISGVPAMNLIDEFRRRLEDAHWALLRTVALTDEELGMLAVPPAAGQGENVPQELATGILSRLEGQGKHELDELEAARRRLEAGRFGACEDCGGSIPLARLRAQPAARHCLPCQMRRETTAGGE
jgi:RNA polymerase-binding transcription factor DksA